MGIARSIFHLDRDTEGYLSHLSRWKICDGRFKSKSSLRPRHSSVLTPRSNFADPEYSDFTIVCAGKQYKVHRVILKPHSQFFDKAFKNGFREAEKQRMVLDDDLPEAVDCMIQYFYKFDYEYTLAPTPAAISYSDSEAPLLEYEESTEPPKKKTKVSHDNADLEKAVATPAAPVDTNAREPSFPIQLHAWVYAVADKYDVPGLKELAFQKFKQAGISALGNKAQLLAAASTLYNHIMLPEKDVALLDVLMDMWVLATGSLYNTMTQQEDFVELVDISPCFAADYMRRLMSGFKDRKMWVFCSKCGKRVHVPCVASDGAPTSTVSGHGRHNNSDTCWAAGAVIHIKDDVEVLGSVKISKFW